MTDLPNPRWRVLAIAKRHYYPHWWELSETGEWWSNDACGDADSQELTVVDHPRNDPEAVEIIRKAKEAK